MASPASVASAPRIVAASTSMSNSSSVSTSLAVDAGRRPRRAAAASRQRSGLGQHVHQPRSVSAGRPPSEGHAAGPADARGRSSPAEPTDPRSSCSTSIATRQPASRRTEPGVDRHRDAVEEDLAELLVAGHLPHRPHVDAGRCACRGGRTRCPGARASGVGAGEEDARARPAARSSPHLLAVDHVAVAVGHGRRPEAPEVGAGAGLGEQLAPQHLAGERRRQEPRLLRRRCPSAGSPRRRAPGPAG